MCEPVTATAAITAGVSVASHGYGAYRAREQGKLAKKAAERNAALAEMAASDAEARGAVESGRVRSQGVYDRAKVVAGMLAQGVDGASSGLADVLRGMGINSETDAETVRNNAARQAWGYRNQAATSLFEGEVAAQRANDEMIGEILSGVGKAANAAGSFASLPGAERPTSGLGVRDVPNSSRQLKGW